MKSVRYTAEAASDLRRHRSIAKRIMGKVDRYAETGAGDLTRLVGSEAKRLRDGDFRIVFVETEAEVLVTRIGPRGAIYARGNS
jgi:mRNA interferase RelE/StbE